MKPKPSSLRTWALTAMMGWASAVPLGWASAALEAHNRLQAQFVYNFANFVEWPADAFNGPEAALKICLFGGVPFAPYMDAFAGTLIGRRELTVLTTSDFEDIRAGCHILYVGHDERVRLPSFWDELSYFYVLSVGARAGFADQGGIINILRTRDRMQFEINLDNALANGLFLDSDLLALARTLKRSTQAPAAPSGTAMPRIR